MHIIDIVKRSLDAIAKLDYPCFQLIVVDNGSNDGSREVIEEYLTCMSAYGLNTKIVRLARNWGFAGGVNAAYRAMDRDTKFIAIVNNDAIPKSDYLTNLITFLDEHEDVGAVQGVVTKLHQNSLVDSAGGFLDEVLNLHFPFLRKPTDLIRQPTFVSYVEGTMPVYAVEAIRSALSDNNNMFITVGFMYYLEDVFLSLMLWSHGYKCVVLPLITGEHYRMATITKFSESIHLSYYTLRNYIALLCVTNSRAKAMTILRYLRRLVISKAGSTKRKMVLNALIDGMKLGKELRKTYGIIDLHRVPMLKTRVRDIVKL